MKCFMQDENCAVARDICAPYKEKSAICFDIRCIPGAV